MQDERFASPTKKGGVCDCCVVIPALNPQPSLLGLLRDLLSCGFENIVVVNDGSREDFEGIFLAAADLGVVVLRHDENLGKGAALKTAFQYVYLKKYAAVVTVDADGQHSAEDAARVACEVLGEDAPVCVLGVRTFSADVPIRSRIGNILTKRLFFAFSSLKIADTQTGLRGFSNDLLPIFCEIPWQRYEFEMKMLLWLVERKVPIKEIPIKTIYIDGNSNSHFNPLMDSLRIYWVLFRDLFVSISSFGIDIAFFVIFYAITDQVLVATYFSRVLSGSYNFVANKFFVFKLVESGRIAEELLQYLALAVSLATVSGLVVGFIFEYTGWAITLCKIFVDSFFYLISFFVRRFFIFPKNN